MAPIRRYLRITEWSVLEVRIYLDNPALADTWLLRRRDPALPRVIQAVRPLVIPKLREENERAKGKGKGKRAKGIKDSVSEDDFEVSIFLTDLSTPHSLLTKHKDFGKENKRLKSNSGKLTGWLTGASEGAAEMEAREDPVIIREESDDEEGLRVGSNVELDEAASRRKRSREELGEESLFVEETVSDDEGFTLQSEVQAQGLAESESENEPDKNKLGLNTSYEGFSIYGRILCLVVKRKGGKGKSGGGGQQQEEEGGRQMLERWVSTQAVQEPGITMLDDA